MFDFSSIATNSENPTFLTILFTILFSFLMSVMIAFTYEKTSRQVARPDNYIQSLVLIALVAATIMQAIGDSLARGLGMLGALSIIRFRTTLRNPRNIVFMFSSLAAGIACGVGGFVIAFVGTVGLCVSAFLLRLTPFSRQQNLVGTLSFELPSDSPVQKQTNDVLKKHCVKYSIQSYRIFNSEAKLGQIQCSYQLRLKEEMNGLALATELKSMEMVKNVRLRFNDTEDII